MERSMTEPSEPPAIVQAIIQNLYTLRGERLQALNQLINLGDPNAPLIILADIIGLAENLFIMMNMPQDGFVPFTQKDEKGGSS